MKKILVLLILLAAAGGAAVYWLLQDSVDIYLTEEQLQSRVDETFPVEQRHLGVVNVRLSDPEVRLTDGSDRIHYGMRAEGSIMGVGSLLDGRALVSGTVRYEPEEGEFYFDDLQLEEIEAEGVGEEHLSRVREAVAVGLREALRRQPIYRLEEDDIRHSATRLVLRDVSIVDGRLRIRLQLGRGSG